MARQRMLNPSFFTDARVCALSPLARLFFQGLWGLADREGRLEDRPHDIKIRVLPGDICNGEELMRELVAQELVIRYVACGQRLVQVRNFLKHQHPHKQEAPSRFPAPSEQAPKEHSACSEQAPNKHRRCPAESESESESNTPQPPKGGGVGLADAVTQPHSILQADQLPTVTDLKAFQPKQPSPAVAAHAEGPPLAERMDAVFSEVRGGAYRQVSRGRDSDALAMGRLLGKGSHAEILTRWKRGLQWRGFPGCSTWMELDANWNAYAKTQDSTAGPGKAGGDRPRL